MDDARDEELIRAGDYARLLARYRYRIRQRVRVKVPERDVDDVVSEIFLYLYRELASGKFLHALNRPGMSRSPALVWFPGVTREGVAEAELADDFIDRGLSNLQDLNVRLRGALELVNARTASREERRSRDFQNTLTLLAGVLLVPTLVASIYGANTELPGRGSWTGFGILVAAMVISALVTYIVIRDWQRRRSNREQDSES
jgi:hypothetical protein